MKLLIKDIKNLLPGLIAAFIVCAVLTYRFGTCCPLRIITGLPCPACGTVRSFLALLRLDIRQMLWYQPVMPLMLVFFIIYCYKRYHKGQNCKNLCYAMTVFLIITGISAYVVRMYKYYPDKPPLEYTENNLLHTIKEDK